MLEKYYNLAGMISGVGRGTGMSGAGGGGGGSYYKIQAEFILQKSPGTTKVAKIVVTPIVWGALYHRKLTTCFFSFCFRTIVHLLLILIRRIVTETE